MSGSHMQETYQKREKGEADSKGMTEIEYFYSFLAFFFLCVCWIFLFVSVFVRFSLSCRYAYLQFSSLLLLLSAFGRGRQTNGKLFFLIFSPPLSFLFDLSHICPSYYLFLSHVLFPLSPSLLFSPFSLSLFAFSPVCFSFFAFAFVSILSPSPLSCLSVSISLLFVSALLCLPPLSHSVCAYHPISFSSFVCVHLAPSLVSVGIYMSVSLCPFGSLFTCL